MFFADRLTFDASRRTGDGYLVARARAARSGVYEYLGREIDPEGKHFAADAVVNVYRPEDEVFDQASVASFLMKPVTNDHPRDAVTADNWREHAKGVVGRAMRDGEHLAFDLVLMDAALIRDVEAGKRELSNGYGCSVDIEDGTAPDGTAYSAVQRGIRGNHVAVVDKGRAGSSCRIGDAATCTAIASAEIDKILADQRTYDPTPDGGNVPFDRRETNKSHEGPSLKDGDAPMATKTILVDGLQVEVTDAAEAAINKLQGQLKDAASAKAKAETELATAKTELAAKDTEITTLTQAVADAKVTPAQLRDAAKAYAMVCDKAKALGVTFAEDADASAIMKAVVDAKMGDAAKDWSADQVAASFAVLTKDAKVEQRDALTDAIKNGVRTQTDDSERQQAYGEMVTSLTDAWKPKAA
jgi:hypothetical protein